MIPTYSIHNQRCIEFSVLSVIIINTSNHTLFLFVKAETTCYDSNTHFATSPLMIAFKHAHVYAITT